MKKIFYVLLPIIAIVCAFFYLTMGDGKKNKKEGEVVVSDDKPKIPEVEELPKFTYGIDISKFQGNEVEKLTDQDDVSFIICKATEGVTYTDPKFRYNWKMIKNKNKIRGAYHFYRSDDKPEAQASNFANAIKDLSADDLPPIIDVEQGGISSNMTIEAVQDNLIPFLKKVEELLKRKPMIYTSPTFADKYLNNPSLSSYPLWLAEYGVENPRLPKTWEEGDWVFWQKSDSYKLESQNTDLDVFKGSIDDLNAFIKKN